jgi:uncharacterized protein (TIGR02118 family)
MHMFQTLFIVWQAPDERMPKEAEGLLAAVAHRLRGLRQALAMTPVEARADQPFAADGRGPPLVLELDFATMGDAEAAAQPIGPLADLMRPGAVPGLRGAQVASQGMAGRRFAVPEPCGRLDRGGASCTFLVDYPGTTADLEAWLDHYDARHAPIMVRFPGIRDVATFRPVGAARNDLPGGRLQSMQRNKVVFDSPEALFAALASPVMNEMRADAARFPPFSPRARHFPMSTRDLLAF